MRVHSRDRRGVGACVKQFFTQARNFVASYAWGQSKPSRLVEWEKEGEGFARAEVGMVGSFETEYF